MNAPGPRMDFFFTRSKWQRSRETDQLQISSYAMAIGGILLTKLVSKILFLRQNDQMMNHHDKYRCKKQDRIQRVQNGSEKCRVHAHVHWVPTDAEQSADLQVRLLF